MTLRVIAIDGPAGAGKSTVARAVAQAVSLPYLDTGAMYRGVAFAVLRERVDPSDEVRVGAIAESVQVVVEPEGVAEMSARGGRRGRRPKGRQRDGPGA